MIRIPDGAESNLENALHATLATYSFDVARCSRMMA
jgi:hypothetical protein